MDEQHLRSVRSGLKLRRGFAGWDADERQARRLLALVNQRPRAYQVELVARIGLDSGPAIVDVFARKLLAAGSKVRLLVAR